MRRAAGLRIAAAGFVWAACGTLPPPSPLVEANPLERILRADGRFADLLADPARYRHCA